MKIDIQLNEIQKSEILRDILVEQYEKVTAIHKICDNKITKDTLLESIKNLIYWNSTNIQYIEFLEKNMLEE